MDEALAKSSGRFSGPAPRARPSSRSTSAHEAPSACSSGRHAGRMCAGPGTHAGRLATKSPG
jgi:hypothetical protein